MVRMDEKTVKRGAKEKRLIDRRLLGTWRSDRRRTITDWHWQKRVTAKQKHRLAKFFGRLKVRYTRNRIYTEFEDYRDVKDYRVIGQDSESVAIVYWESLREEEVITQIHFEGHHYWINIWGNGNREWFRRIQQ
jgi:hypothetical protein